MKPTQIKIRIARGALGPDVPCRDMVVSPQHRMLAEGHAVELATGEAEALVAATMLLGFPGIERVAVSAVTYIHIMFDRHEVIRADDAWTESFQPGEQTLGDMEKAAREELLSIFPELATDRGLKAYEAARISLRRHEARAVFQSRLAA